MDLALNNLVFSLLEKENKYYENHTQEDSHNV